MSNVKRILRKLRRLMNGYNYDVTFGFDVFDNCSTIDHFKKELKMVYKDAKPDNVELVLLNTVEFWEEINFALNYRGDSGAGLALKKNKEEELHKVQAEYKSLIEEAIHEKTKIYNYPDEEGIPAYSVFWDYRFVLFTENGRCLFIYGAASD